MATKISTRDVPEDLKYEPGFKMRHGITDETTTVKDGGLGLVRFPPNTRSRPHYHTAGDLMYYCISGKSIWYVGKEKKEYVIEAGDFLFIPRGEVHSTVNPSDTDFAEGVGGYSGVSNPYKSGKVFVD